MKKLLLVVALFSTGAVNAFFCNGGGCPSGSYQKLCSNCTVNTIDPWFGYDRKMTCDCQMQNYRIGKKITHRIDLYFNSKKIPGGVKLMGTVLVDGADSW